MKQYRATARRIIRASPEKVYGILADYRNCHPQILPKPYFLPMEVEQGGIGKGTVIRFQMRVFGRIRNYGARITEPEPGRQLDETYTEPDGVCTRFFVLPHEEGTEVTIVTEGPTLGGRVAGWLERLVAGVYLRRIIKRELELLAVMAESMRECRVVT